MHPIIDKLLTACQAQHVALDTLFAMLASEKEGFFPSKSGQPWAALLQGNAAINEALSVRKRTVELDRMLLIRIISLLGASEHAFSFAILATPTGEARNKLTDDNLRRMELVGILGRLLLPPGQPRDRLKVPANPYSLARYMGQLTRSAMRVRIKEPKEPKEPKLDRMPAYTELGKTDCPEGERWFVIKLSRNALSELKEGDIDAVEAIIAQIIR
ncbi:hypothetical protein LCGC14_0753000 [marine sediment metagenome]|uniref:Uncharacterized protein n=1 Tax=marine sediment metagenome TaxID=412755 RepID=A0A0F9SNL6_9ZZZZ